MKKALKIFIGFLTLFFLTLIVTPYFFEDKIVTILKENINKNVNAKVDFEDVDISLISGFPNAKVSLNNLLITTFKPFDGDTLASVKKISLNIPLSSLFKISSGQINITSFSIADSKVNIQIDNNGKANYDIGKETTESNTKTIEENESTISLGLERYNISNSTIQYFDKSSKTFLILTDFNHSGSGNLSTAISELKTETSTTISFEMDSTKYLNNNSITLDAMFNIDLNENKYSFLENKAVINQLALVFDGYIKLNEDNQELDINFRTPSSDFKNFLALVPKAYSKDISDVKTTGNFEVKGFAKGTIDNEHIPSFNIELVSENASFKYPDLQKTINNIDLNTAITNTTGISYDTKLNIKKLSFKIDENTFTSSAQITNPVNNPKVKARAKGTINLKSIGEAYPMEGLQNLQGVLKADFKTAFDMQSIERKRYKNTQNSGTLSLENFKYDGDETANPIDINNAKVTFKTNNVTLNNFEAKTGNSDLKINGNINNLIGFVLNDKNIQGTFKMTSNNFDVSDFMALESTSTDSTQTNSKEVEQLKIPSFLDCSINAHAANVTYDNLKLKDVKGTLVIKDEKATLQNLSSSLFDGKIVVDGTISTKEDIPTFALKMGISNFDISQSFSELKLFEALAPIGKLVQGKINTNLNLTGFLNHDLSPNLTSVSGDALSEIFPTKASLKNSQALSLLGNNLSFIDLDNLDFNALKAAISFEDGKVAVKPFNIKYKDIDIEISGKHGFDKSMDYNLYFDIPAKYLGSEVSSLLANLSDQDTENITVPLSANIVGSFSNPTLKTNMSEAVSNLSNQLLEQQKNKLTKQGEDELNKLLNSNSKSNDSTKTNTTTEAAKSILNSLFKKKK